MKYETRYDMLRAKFSEWPQVSEGQYDPKVFSIYGRIGRLRFICYQCAMLIFAIGLLIAVFAINIGWINKGHTDAAMLYLFAIALYVIGTLASIPCSIRRLHDLNLSGWCSLILLIPTLNSIFFLFLSAVPGDAQPNKFGPAPSPNSLGVIIFSVLCIVAPILLLYSFKHFY